MTKEEFYGDGLPRLLEAESQLRTLLSRYSLAHSGEGSLFSIQNISSRIKEPESMIRKLKSRGLPADGSSALSGVHDALGLRVVCSFTNGVYRLARWLAECPEYEVIKEKDYISHPKENGYRSYHVILKIKEGETAGLYAEIQLRTIAQDFWASLEHQIKYKQELPHEKLIKSELKRCADQIASVDLTMQTIQELVKNPASDKS